jgi:hypothetical protein
VDRSRLTVVDIVAARENRAIEDDRRALEVARRMVSEESGPWTRLSFAEEIVLRAGVRMEIASAAEDIILFEDRSLVETEDWQLVPRPS